MRKYLLFVATIYLFVQLATITEYLYGESDDLNNPDELSSHQKATHLP